MKSDLRNRRRRIRMNQSFLQHHSRQRAARRASPNASDGRARGGVSAAPCGIIRARQVAWLTARGGHSNSIFQPNALLADSLGDADIGCAQAIDAVLW